MIYSILLIGSGKWGKNYISTLSSFKDVNLKIANRDNWKSLIDQNPHGIIVCTPPQSHIEIASYALNKNIPTMIEKPLALSLKEAEILKQYSAPILVNHIYLFAYKYQHIKQNINPDNILYMITSGCGPSAARDYSELWDYGPHDLAMILDLSQQLPNDIKCYESSAHQFTIELKFDKFKTISLVGYGDIKDRRLQTSSDDILYEYSDDYMLQKLLYGKVLYEDLPLTNALNVFIDAISGKTDYRLGLDLSFKVLQILEECQKSLDRHFVV